MLQFHGSDGLGDAPQAVPTAASVTISASEGQYSTALHLLQHNSLTLSQLTASLPMAPT